MKKLYISSNEKDISFRELYNEFRKSREYLNVTDKTLKHYDNCFKLFSSFYDVEQQCSEFNEEVISEYVFHLKKKGTVNEVTINAYITAVRAIAYFGMERGYIKGFAIKLIRAGKKVKETYTKEELGILLKKPDMKKCNFAEYRTWVMTNYLLATGNRLSTLAELKLEDINFKDGEIIMKKTKNRKQQIIPLSQELGKVLREYLTYRKGEPEEPLFCTVYGGKLSTGTIQSEIKRYNQKRGILKTSIHAYRHTFAKNWILNGGDIFTLQKILGHSSIEMVKNYVNLYSDELKIGFNSYNPLDRMMKESGKGEHIRMK